ncbi:MAG: carbohydrate ABC transporter permease [Candidatus Methanomethylicaceae archaeon]
MAFKNTALIAACTTISTMFLAVIASYAVIRLRFRFNRRIFVSVFLTQFVPPFVIIIPLYFVMNGLKLLGTYQGVIFAQMTFALPYAIWLLYGYFVTFPYELEEAAWIDGCSRLQAIIKIILPLSGPGLIATGIFVFVGAWNDLLYTLIIGAGRIKTIPVKLAEYIGEARIVYELMFPAAVISTIPILLVGLIFQKYIVKGIAEGALRT